jgi:hypothetical protein
MREHYNEEVESTVYGLHDVSTGSRLGIATILRKAVIQNNFSSLS